MSDGDFEAVDYQVMGLAYEIHNQQGRLCDERIYQNLLALRCKACGFRSVQRETPVKVTHKSFEETYYLDILMNNGAVFELKATETLTGEHESQVINYLLLSGLRHGKLINMRPESVEGKRVLTRLNPDKRKRLNLLEEDWKPRTGRCEWFRKTMAELLTDWGGFLSVSLYQEAVRHFLGGREKVEKSVEFIVDGRVVGGQSVRLLSKRVAFEITAVKEGPEYDQEPLTRLLRHTELDAIQWVNMVSHDIHFRTIQR
jgi:GxxExxY protein